MQFATTLSNNNGPLCATLPELRILLVEDSLPLRSRLTECLTEPGLMQVTATAESEAQAIAHIDAQDFDILVVDVELRPGSGINVIRHARAHWLLPPLPLIIVLTNHALPTVKARCLVAGADHFLDKMRQFEHLYPLISQHRK